jgi:hypothetical protein
MRKTFVLLLSLLFATVALAQGEPPAPTPPPANGGLPHVYYVHSYYKDHPHMAGLDDLISVYVQNFNTLLTQVDGNCSAIVLFLNGMAVKGLKPVSCDALSGHVRYRLERTADNDSVWHDLLGRPRGFAYPISVSVGKDTSFSVTSTVTDFELEVIPRQQFYAFVILLIAAMLFFIYLCRNTSLIRSNAPGVPPDEQPYSLSQFQMAVWFFLVIAAYIFIWLICDELDTITDSVLGLIGIGSATAIGAAVIDQNKATIDAATRTTRGFLRDVMSDNTGAISLHRFQMFVWTLVLGLIFVVSVYNGLEMPEFSATLLGLMGISSGTYLGFKVPENAAPAAPAATPPAPVSS